MKNEVVSKTLALFSIFLFISIIITPIITGNNFVDDTTPPITTYTLDPPTPDGDNGWYVSDVNVTLNATDDMSGVNMTYYRVNSGEWKVYNSTFVISEDGDDILIEYFSVDNANNQEVIKQASIDMDQTKPVVDLTYEWEIIDETRSIYLYRFNATANDLTSCMNRTEFYLNGILWKTVYGLGPYYILDLIFDFNYSVRGFIIKGKVTEEYVKFFAISVFIDISFHTQYLTIEAYAYDNAGNYKIDGIYSPNFQIQSLDLNRFKWYTFSNDYEGFIGKFYIDADFERSPIKVSPVTNVLNFEPNNLFLRFLDHFPLLHLILDIWGHHLL